VSVRGPAEPTDDSLAIYNGPLPLLTPYINIKLKGRKIPYINIKLKSRK